MWVGPVFEGDNNKTLMMVQHDIYHRLVWDLYNFSANKYLNDIKYTFVYPDFVPIIRTKESFDHRVLQVAHDIIAAYYRFILVPTHDAIIVPEDFDLKKYYEAAWKEYYLQEVAILSTIDEIAEAIVISVAYQNTDRGYEAEDKRNRLLWSRYSNMPSHLRLD